MAFFFKKLKNFLLTYLREREKAREGGGAEGEGEAASLLSAEPDLGLNPRTLGS